MFRRFGYLVLTFLVIAGPALAGGPTPEAFPQGFWWGTLVSAHAVEGSHANDWTLWESQPGSIADGSVSGQACNHWELFPEDQAWMKKLGQNAVLMSLEWSRLQPAKGPFDPAAVQNYRARLEGLRKLGIEPVVILWDRTLPQWVAGYGGLMMPCVITDFQDFAAECGKTFGDLVDYWVTLRDPVGFAGKAFKDGRFPPGKSEVKGYSIALIDLMGMHRGAWQALKNTDTATAAGGKAPNQVGLIVGMKWVRPNRPGNPADLNLARTRDFASCLTFLDGVMKGDLVEANPGTPNQGPKGKGAPEVPPPAPPASYDHRRADFIVVSYQGLEEVKFNLLKALFTEKVVPPGFTVDDEGQVVFADGLTSVLLSVKKYPVPFYVLAGMADAAGQKRGEFIAAHVRQTRAALVQGCNVQGFFYDGLLQGFEFDRGFGLKKGLISVNPTIQERKAAPGAEIFRALALSNGASDAPRRMKRPQVPAARPAGKPADQPIDQPTGD